MFLIRSSDEQPPASEASTTSELAARSWDIRLTLDMLLARRGRRFLDGERSGCGIGGEARGRGGDADPAGADDGGLKRMLGLYVEHADDVAERARLDRLAEDREQD